MHPLDACNTGHSLHLSTSLVGPQINPF